MKNKSKGFTLVELLIVIAIIGLLSAVLFPTIINARRNSVNTAAKMYARNMNQWVTSWLAQDALRSISDLDTSCIDAGYVGEGADSQLPSFITACEVLQNPNGEGTFGARVTTGTGEVHIVYQ